MSKRHSHRIITSLFDPLSSTNGSRWTVAAESKTSVTLVPTISGNPCFTGAKWMKFVICQSFKLISCPCCHCPIPLLFVYVFSSQKKKKRCPDYLCLYVFCETVKLWHNYFIFTTISLFHLLLSLPFFIQSFLYFKHLYLYLFSNFIPSKVLYHHTILISHFSHTKLFYLHSPTGKCSRTQGFNPQLFFKNPVFGTTNGFSLHTVSHSPTFGNIYKHFLLYRSYVGVP